MLEVRRHSAAHTRLKPARDRPRDWPRQRLAAIDRAKPPLPAASAIMRTQRYDTAFFSNPSCATCPMPDHCAARRSEIAVSGAADFASRYQNRLIPSPAPML